MDAIVWTLDTDQSYPAPVTLGPSSRIAAIDSEITAMLKRYESGPYSTNYTSPATERQLKQRVVLDETLYSPR